MLMSPSTGDHEWAPISWAVTQAMTIGGEDRQPSAVVAPPVPLATLAPEVTAIRSPSGWTETRAGNPSICQDVPTLPPVRGSGPGLVRLDTARVSCRRAKARGTISAGQIRRADFFAGLRVDDAVRPVLSPTRIQSPVSGPADLTHRFVVPVRHNARRRVAITADPVHDGLAHPTPGIPGGRPAGRLVGSSGRMSPRTSTAPPACGWERGADGRGPFLRAANGRSIGVDR